MAFDGTLLTVNGSSPYYITGLKYINEASYKATRIIQDVDSYRDATGFLHRNPLEHNSYKIELTTREDLTNSEWNEFWTGITRNFTAPLERKSSVKAYIPELDNYITFDAYSPDPEITIKTISENTIKYNPITVKFIGY